MTRSDEQYPITGPNHECDSCSKEFPKESPPKESYQTYLGEWFCSDECGRLAGW